MINFDEDADLGQVVSSKKLESFGEKPLKDIRELVYVAGGNKLSNLCKFKFTSKAPIQYKEFCIAFVCKIRSKIYHKKNIVPPQNSVWASNPSQWFIFKIINDKEIHCLSKRDLLVSYGFDIDKFFESDYFAEGLKFFKECINKGCDVYVPEYVKAHADEEVSSQISFNRPGATVKMVAPIYVTAIKESLEYIDNKKVNDKFYKLISYDGTIFEVEAKDAFEEELDKAIEEAVADIYK